MFRPCRCRRGEAVSLPRPVDELVYHHGCDQCGWLYDCKDCDSVVGGFSDYSEADKALRLHLASDCPVNTGEFPIRWDEWKRLLAMQSDRIVSVVPASCYTGIGPEPPTHVTLRAVPENDWARRVLMGLDS